MKYINIMGLCAILCLLPMLAGAQDATKINIKGLVSAADGSPLVGATVAGEQDGISVVTDSTGAFEVEATSGAIISVSAQDYATKFVTASENVGQILLINDAENTSVNVAHQKVRQHDLMGGVSHVNISELLEKNYITFSLDNMEAFAPGFHGALWGNDEMLVLVDGVPRDLGSVQPVEVEQVTFLKGVAAVALYGSMAAKGVVLITTKRGVAGDTRINVRANTGVNVARMYPKFLGSAEYMSLYNEARLNDGLSELYSEEDIYHHASGENPYRYPNVDYYSSEYLQKAYMRSDATVEISGGNERTRYYTNMGFWTAGSQLNFGEAQDNRDTRLNIRGNVDMKLSRFITAKVDAAAVFYNGRGINTDYWGSAANTRPYRFAPLIPISMIEEGDQNSLDLVNNGTLIDGKYLLGGTQLEQTNSFADIYAGGTSTYTSRQFQFNAGVNADLSNVLKGLSFNTLFGVDYATSYVLSFNNDYAVYEPEWNNYTGEDLITSLTKYGIDARSGVQNIEGNFFRQTLSLSTGFNYRRTLKGDHNLSGMLVASGFQRAVSSQYHRIGNANIGIHAGYNFKNKYYAEFNGSVIHSAKLPVKNRQAFSPTVSLGWRLSNEGFLSGTSAINNLRLHVSAGILHTDLDIEDFYLYENIYRQTDGAWYTWKDGLNNTSTDVRRGENPDLDFPKREEVSVGIDASLFDNSIVFTGSVFASRMTGIVNQNTNLFPSYFVTGFPESSFVPYVNYNNDQRKGFDYSVNFNKRLGTVNWTLGLVGTYFETKATKRAEIYGDGYQNRQGKALDAIWGLKSDGFFDSQEEINNSPRQAFGEVRPGDIKYIDQNNDGVINAQDEVYLGRGGWFGSPFTTGVNLTAKWKDLTFFALAVARMGAKAITGSNYFWVNGEDKYSEVVRDRWTPETMETATFPRLTTQNGDNNFRSSDFWLINTNRFDLARVQVSYQFPERLIGNGVVRELGVYVNAVNLLTIAPNRDLLLTNVGAAPQTAFFNLGVKAQF